MTPQVRRLYAATAVLFAIGAVIQTRLFLLNGHHHLLNGVAAVTMTVTVAGCIVTLVFGGKAQARP